MQDFYPRLFPRLNEDISYSSIKDFVASGNKPEIEIDDLDGKVFAVQGKYREDTITQSYVNSRSPKIKNYLLDFLKEKNVSIENVDDAQITLGEFWDRQALISEEKQKSSSKKEDNYEFDEHSISILNDFYDSHGKLNEFTEFIKHIPAGTMKYRVDRFFKTLSMVVTGEHSIMKVGAGEIGDKSESFTLNSSEQEGWKREMINYLFKFDEIEQLNHGSFYQDSILNPKTFINAIFSIDTKGVGKGEVLICYLFEGAQAQGGSEAFDIILLNGKKYEVKEYVTGGKIGIRFGKEGKLTQFPFWNKITYSISTAKELLVNHEEELKKSISNFFFSIWQKVTKDESPSGYKGAVLAGINAGEMGEGNLNILRMWYYLAHELVFKEDYIELGVPKKVVDRLAELHYVKDPEQLDKDLKESGESYFKRIKDLDAFIVFRANKMNIVRSGEFEYDTISQAGVKFLETELSRKTENEAQIAFRKWKEEVNKTIEKFENQEDKEELRNILRGLTVEDFRHQIFKETHKGKVEKGNQERYEKNLMGWAKRKDQLESNPKKTPKQKEKWYQDNPKPALEESLEVFYPRLRQWLIG